MKVKDLVQMVTTNYDAEDEVIVLIYSKDTFDYPEEDEMTLTDEGWLKMVEEMESSGALTHTTNIFQMSLARCPASMPNWCLTNRNKSLDLHHQPTKGKLCKTVTPSS